MELKNKAQKTAMLKRTCFISCWVNILIFLDVFNNHFFSFLIPKVHTVMITVRHEIDVRIMKEENDGIV